jgi:hypothetical protein
VTGLRLALLSIFPLLLGACVDGRATIIDLNGQGGAGATSGSVASSSAGGSGGSTSSASSSTTSGGAGGSSSTGAGGSGGVGGVVPNPCGNGVIDAGEDCDDGNANNTYCDSNCDIVCSGVLRSDGHCYVELAMAGLMWGDAAQACSNIAAHLPVLNDAAEVTFLEGSFGAAGYDVWSAGRDIGMTQDGQYRYSTPGWPSDDMLVPSDVWLASQPNDEGLSDCCYLKLDGGSRGLNDHLCNDSYAQVLCERPPPEGL